MHQPTPKVRNLSEINSCFSWLKCWFMLFHCSTTYSVFQQAKENLTQAIKLWALSPIFQLWFTRVLGKQLSGQFFRKVCGEGQILMCWQKSVNFHPVHRPSGMCFTPSHSSSNQKEQCWLIWEQEHTAGHCKGPESPWVGQLNVLQIMVKHSLVLEQRHGLGKPLRYQAHLPQEFPVSTMSGYHMLTYVSVPCRKFKILKADFENYKTPTPQQLIINNYFLYFINEVLQKCLYIPIQLLHSLMLSQETDGQYNLLLC